MSSRPPWPSSKTVGGVAAAATADVSDERAFAGAIAELRRELGPVDLLVNNAGIVGPIGPMWEVELDAWWRAMEVNVRGVLVGTQLVLPDMIARGGGRIINLASQAGVFRWPMVSSLLRVEGGGRQAHGKPGARNCRVRSQRVQRASRAAPDRTLGDRHRRTPGGRLPRGTHSQLGDARAARRQKARTPSRRSR